MVGLLSSFNSPYIDTKYYNNLRTYQYKGGENSIFYCYCTSPFCNWAVEYCPCWLA